MLLSPEPVTPPWGTSRRRCTARRSVSSWGSQRLGPEIQTVAIAGWWARGKTPLKNDGFRQLRDDDRNPIFLGKCQKWQPNHQPEVRTSHSAPFTSGILRFHPLLRGQNWVTWKQIGLQTPKKKEEGILTVAKVGDFTFPSFEGLLPNFGSSEAAGSADEPSVLGKRLRMTHQHHQRWRDGGDVPNETFPISPGCCYQNHQTQPQNPRQ